MPRSKTSNRWLKEHFSDMYVKKAQQEGYRSRAIYKLKELDEKEHLLKPGMTVIDLGAAPGGWTQYVSEKLKEQGLIIALDVLPMDAFADVKVIQGDFQEEAVFHRLLSELEGRSVDLILSDMAPNMSGNDAIDIPKAMFLVELTLDLAEKTLTKGGALVTKIFHGRGFDEILKETRQRFAKVQIKKPQASRARSRETYLLAKGYNL